MGDGLSVGGGAGGFGAAVTDLRTEAHVLRDAGGDLTDRVGTVARMAVEDDLLAAALVCPELVPGVEAAILTAATGPDGLALRGAALLATGVLLDAIATTYEAVDGARARALDALQTAGGFALGGLLPAGVLLGGSGLAALLATNPLLAAQLAHYATTGEMTDDLQQTLYEHPWLLEALTRAAPGMIQSTAFTLGSLVPAGPLALTLLIGGRWPTGDYEDAVSGLIGLAHLGGYLDDTGTFHLGDDPATTRVRWSPDTAVEDIFREQGLMDDGLTEAEHTAAGQLRVVTVPQPGGGFAYVVQVPGTEVWGAQRGDNPVDLTSNVQMMTQQESVMKDTVAQAIRDLHLDGPVMLTGHSQGGITAASLASDPALVRELGIRSVVTGGSPIGRFDIDPGVSVLSVEHVQDPVPMLDGTSNPDRANWTTVRQDLGERVDTPFAAHDTRLYASTGAAVDASGDPTLAAWREANAQFFSGSGTAEATRYSLEAG